MKSSALASRLSVLMLGFIFLGIAGFQLRAGTPRVGINLAMDGFYADAMHQSRPHWDSPEHEHWGDAKAAEDEQGWPTQDASIMVWEGRSHNEGTYTLVFNGKAKVDISFNYGTFSPDNGDATGTYDEASNTTTATLKVTDTGGQNCSLIFTHTQRTPTSGPNTGVTHVRLYRPVTEGADTSYTQDALFTNPMIALMQKFCVVRPLFVEQAGADGNVAPLEWADRTRPVDGYLDKIPYEYQVQLANQANVDLYINTPILASNDYITKLAQLIKYGSDGVNPYTSVQGKPVWPGLKPNLHVYVEYSNEIWNNFFKQTHTDYDFVKGDEKNHPEEWAVLNFDGAGTGWNASPPTGNIYELAWRRVGYKIKEISDIFRAVYGDAAMPPNPDATVRPLLEFQNQDGQGTGDTELSFLESYYDNGDGLKHVDQPHPVNYFIWGGGGATYYTSNNDKAASMDDLFNSGIPSTGVNHTQDYQKMAMTDSTWVKAFGLKRVAYEGGFAVANGKSGFSSDKGTPAVSARFDPRAKTAEISAQTIFEQGGGDLNIFYISSNPSDNYTWGMTMNVADLTTPLYQAVDAINASAPAPVTNGTPLSASSPTTLTYDNQSAQAWAGDFNGDMAVHGGGEIVFSLLAAAPGSYQVAMDISENRQNQHLRMLIDGQVVGKNIDVPVTAADANTRTYQSVAVGEVHLTAGQHCLLLKGAVNDVAGYKDLSGYIKDIVLTPASDSPK